MTSDRGCLLRLAAGAHCGEAVPAPAADDADHPAYIFTEPRFGYRMEKGEGPEQEAESSD